MMDNQALSTNLTPRDDVSDKYWLHMEIKKDPLQDGMSMADAASLVDAAYNIKQCEQQASSELWNQNRATAERRDIWTDISDNTGIDEETFAAQQRFADALEIGSYTENCGNGNTLQELIGYAVTIKIFRSHYAELYKLQMANGTASQPGRVADRVVHTLEVKEQNNITLENPIISYRPVKPPVVCWQGVNGPDIHILGNTLWWEGDFTGTIRAEFDTEWDEVTIAVTGDPADSEMITGTDTAWLGTGFYSGSESGDEIDDYQDIECSVLAFYHYQYEELILNSPEEDESVTATDKLNICHFVMTTADGANDAGDADQESRCQQHVNETVVCQCDGKEETESYYTPVNCPPGVSDGSTLQGTQERKTYSDCGRTDEAHDPAVYEEKCCEPWPFGYEMPQCKTVVTRFDGTNEKDFDKSDYPEGTKFVVVAPADGQCGEYTVEQVMNAKNCCDTVPELLWDYDNSAEVTSPDSKAYVFVTGGQLPLTVKVRGSGFWLDAAHSIRDGIISSKAITIYTDAEACGFAQIYVTDGCTSVSGGIKSTLGQWVPRPDVDCNAAPISGIYPADSTTAGFTVVSFATIGKYKYAQGWSIAGNGGDVPCTGQPNWGGCSLLIEPYPDKTKCASTYSWFQSTPNFMQVYGMGVFAGSNNISCGWGLPGEVIYERCRTISVEEWVCP